MLRQTAVFCAWLMIWSLSLPQAFAQNTRNPKPTLKEQVVLLTPGSVVEVTLKNKDKLRGRLGAVTDSGFDLQYVDQGSASNRTLRFDDVKNVKLQGTGMSTAGKIVIGVLAGFGVLVVIALIGLAATGVN